MIGSRPLLTLLWEADSETALDPPPPPPPPVKVFCYKQQEWTLAHLPRKGICCTDTQWPHKIHRKPGELRKKNKNKAQAAENTVRALSQGARKEPGAAGFGPHPATIPSVVLPLCSSSRQIQGWAPISNQPSAGCSCPRCQREGRSGDWRETLKWQKNILRRLISCLLVQTQLPLTRSKDPGGSANSLGRYRTRSLLQKVLRGHKGSLSHGCCSLGTQA